MNHLYQRSKLKFGAFVILVSLFNIAGCASTTIGSDEMLEFRTNCEYADQNIAYLKTVQYDKMDELWAGLKVILWPFGETAQKNLTIATGNAGYWAQGKRENYQRKCGKQG